MADEKLVLEIEANVQNAMAGLKQVQGQMAELMATSHGGGAAAAAGAEGGAIGGALSNLGNFFTSKLPAALKAGVGHFTAFGTGAIAAIEGVNKVVGSLFKAIANPMVLIGGVAAIAGLAELYSTTVRLHDSIYSLSRVMNENTVAASQWIAVGGFLGVQADSIQTAFRFMSQHIDQNAKVLRDMNIATVDAKGNLLPLLDVVQQAQGWFRANENSTLAAARAVEIFGRGGLAILPLLQANKEEFAALTREATSLGLVMDGPALEAQRRMEAQVKLGGEAMRALGINIMQGLMPTLGALGSAINTLVINHLPAITSAIARLAGMIYGFFHTLFPEFTINISEAAKAMADFSGTALNAGSAGDTLGAANDGAANASKALADATRDTTRALNDQIQAINDQDKAFQDSINDQIKALETQGKQESFGDSQAKLAAQKAEKEKEIAKLSSEYKMEILDGDYITAATTLEALTKAQDESANLQNQITKGASDNQRASVIDGLRAQGEAHRAAAQTQAESLRKQIQAVQDAAQEQQSAMSRSLGAISTMTAQTSEEAKKKWSDTMNQITDSFNKGGAAAGAGFASELKKGEWGKIGGDIADKLIGGVMHRLEQWMTHSNEDWSLGGWLKKAGNWVTGGAQGQGAGSGMTWPGMPGTGFSGASGGIVPGPLGSPVGALIHGGEGVFTPDQMKALAQGKGFGGGGSGSGVTIQAINITAPINGTPDELARAIRRELAGAMGRR